MTKTGNGPTVVLVETGEKLLKYLVYYPDQEGSESFTVNFYVESDFYLCPCRLGQHTMIYPETGQRRSLYFVGNESAAVACPHIRATVLHRATLAAKY
jgi:hypothetical protein